MKARLLVTLLLIGVLSLAGCSVLPAGEASNSTVVEYQGNQNIPNLPEGFGLYGSEVEFSGVYAGWNGTVPVTIINGRDKERLFVLSLVQPTTLKEGYEALPKEDYSWVTISETQVTVPAGITYEIPVMLSIPSDVSSSALAGKKYEVGILVEDITQTGFVQIALETKWYIVAGTG